MKRNKGIVMRTIVDSVHIIFLLFLFKLGHFFLIFNCEFMSFIFYYKTKQVEYFTHLFPK